MQASDELDHCFTVDSQSIHRIQESHAMIGHRLWTVAQETMRELRAARRSAPSTAAQTPTREEVSR